MKKLLLGLGAVITTLAPVAAVVSCSSPAERNVNELQKELNGHVNSNWKIKKWTATQDGSNALTTINVWLVLNTDNGVQRKVITKYMGGEHPGDDKFFSNLESWLEQQVAIYEKEQGDK